MGDSVGYIVGGYTRRYRVGFYEDIPYPFSPQSLATAFKGKRGWSGQELDLEEEHVARKVDAFRYYHSEMSHLFDDNLRLSHRIRAFAAAPPRRRVERVWRPA